MAKTNNNKKNNISNNNNSAVKKVNINNVTNKKVNNKKRKVFVQDELKNYNIENTQLVKIKVYENDTSLKKESMVLVNNKDNLNTAQKRKERNRKKYQNQQKKYQDAKKNKIKKTIIIDDFVKDNKVIDIKEDSLVKKKSKVPNKEKLRREKRKNSRKGNHFTQTLVNFKDKSFDKINLVKEKTDDKYIPVGKTKEDKKRRFKRIIKETIVYAIILTIINIICILVFDYFNFLRLFDIKSLNIVVTILISLVLNFFVAFMIDYFITEIWLKKRRKKEVGAQNGDSWINKRKHRKDIEDKERE